MRDRSDGIRLAGRIAPDSAQRIRRRLAEPQASAGRCGAGRALGLLGGSTGHLVGYVGERLEIGGSLGFIDPIAPALQTTIESESFDGFSVHEIVLPVSGFEPRARLEGAAG